MNPRVIIYLALPLLWGTCAFAAEHEEPSVGTETTQVTSESAEKPRVVDTSEVTNWKRSHSRGNDDPNENRNGVYETATMDFTIQIKKEKGQYEIWLILEPTLSTSELKGARNGSDFGAREVWRMQDHYLTKEEQLQEREAHRLEQEKAKIKYAADKVARRKRQQNDLVAIRLKERDLEALKKALEQDLKTAQTAYEVDVAEQKDQAKKDLSRIQTQKKDQLRFIVTLLRDLQVGEKNPDQNAKWLKKNLVAEESRFKDILKEENVALKAVKFVTENLEPFAKQPLARYFDRRIAEARFSHQRLTEEAASLLEAIAAPDKPFVEEPYDDVIARGTPVSIRDEFRRFEFLDRQFAKDLWTNAPVNPAGQKMETWLYLGKYPVPQGKERIRGLVGIMPNSQTRTPYHEVNWKVEIEDGNVTTAIADPANGPIKMWQLKDSQLTKSDGTKQTYPQGVTLESGFMKKPDATVAR